MVKNSRSTIYPNKLYLENNSSFHQMFTALHLDEIRNLETTLHGHCNAGTTNSNKKGTYLQLFDIWLVHNGIANLLLVPRLEKEGFLLTYCTMTTWTIQCPDVTVLNLKRDTGLCDRFPYLDIKQHKDAVVMIQTVRQNYEGYSKRDSKEAILTGKAELKLENSSQKDFINMVSSKSGVKSIPINTHAITNALTIYGPYLPGARGKKTGNQPHRV